MDADRRALLGWQFELTWSLLDLHLVELVEEDFLAEPARHCWTMHRADDGGWVPDFAETEPDPLPAPTIGLMGIGADPETLSSVASTLRNASTDVDAHAGEPPIPQAGEITAVIEAAMRTICEGVANMSASAGGVGDAVAEGRDLYVETDLDSTAHLQDAQPGADHPHDR
ncbi:hypothetical protein IQ251_19065 [Saccharopolyspora sp. HNM0983]|uniref:Uncharacterized protein n=1 Tax=Saccharopolyspora montiporae TaxID=2781240 RepID=A0A929BEG9_9PSEU|nr:hypothetical protein [Saccharopolyspora sp. HNM0983]MBE9376556.1 hypothetical protein [Saccharopolyspora sp. HNM0983]